MRWSGFELRDPWLWIFLLTVLTTPGVAQVRINEIMYHASPGRPEDVRQEWLELLNHGTNAVDLSGWQLTRGVRFNFTNATIPPNGFLVVAADAGVFLEQHPGVSNVVGNWVGQLSNSGETIELTDALGREVDSVTYFSEGDWALRRIGDAFPGQPTWWRGWQWWAPADGGGSSLELVNATMPGSCGQNWAPSSTTNGTPGAVNSAASTNAAPLILDVQHFPLVPSSTNTVAVVARLLDESASGLRAWVCYRLDGSAGFVELGMFDDGAHGDGAVGDGVWGALLPPQANHAVVEFYVRASDAGGRVRTWPAPTDDAGTQGANALYQVDESGYAGTQPLNRLIVTAAEWSAWLNLMDNVRHGYCSNAGMNGALVRSDGLGMEGRYRVAVRNRGQGTRTAKPHNLNVRLPRDQLLKGVGTFDFNSRTVHSQAAGSAIFAAAGLPSAHGSPVQVRINGVNLANAAPAAGDINSHQYGSYFGFEAFDGDWAARHFPMDPDGNIYKAKSWFDWVELVPHADLVYRGTDVALYRTEYSTIGPVSTSGAYAKQSNVAADDWSDLVGLLLALSTNTPPAEYLPTVSRHVNVAQWLRHVAANALIINMETTAGHGQCHRNVLRACSRDRGGLDCVGVTLTNNLIHRLAGPAWDGASGLRIEAVSRLDATVEIVFYTAAHHACSVLGCDAFGGGEWVKVMDVAALPSERKVMVVVESVVRGNAFTVADGRWALNSVWNAHH